MATAWETFPVRFEGGWRTDLGRLDQGAQAPGSATILQNFEVGIDGGYTKIRGYAKFNEAAVPGSGIINGVIVVDPISVLAIRDGSYYLGARDDIAGWALKGAKLTTENRVRHASYNFDGNDKIILVDGLNVPAVYNVSLGTLTFNDLAPADVIASDIVVVFKNHVFFAKNNLLTFTAPYTDNDFDTGDGAGQVNIGSDITGLTVFRDQLIVFSTDKIQRIVGDTSSNFQLLPIANNTGCLSADTIQEVGGDILYLGPDGLRYLGATEKNNDFGLSRASSNIQSEFNRILSPNALYTSFVVRAKNQYRIFNYVDNLDQRASEGFCGTLLSDQSADIAWSQIKGMKIYTGDSKQFKEREVAAFSTGSNYVYLMDVGNSFDGDPIASIFETPYLILSDPRFRKTIYKHTLYVDLQGGIELTARLRFDYNQKGSIQPPAFLINQSNNPGFTWGGSNSLWGSMVYSTYLQELYTTPTVGAGFSVALRYEDNSTNPAFNLDYAVLEYRNNERR